VYCAACGSKLNVAPITAVETRPTVRAPAISWILGGIGAILYGVSNLEFTNMLDDNVNATRVFWALGGLGFFLIFIAIVTSIGTTGKKFGVFPVVLVLIGTLAIAGSEFIGAYVTGTATPTEFNAIYWIQASSYVVIGLAGLISVGTRSKS
jgi:hypothetical protein